MEAQPKATSAFWTGWGQPLEGWCPCCVSRDPASLGSPHAPCCPIPWRSRCSPGQLPGRGASSPTVPRPPGPAPTLLVLPQPLLSLDHWVTTRFAGAGDVRVTVQAACGSSVLQDSKVVRVLGESLGGRAARREPQPHAPVLRGARPSRETFAQVTAKDGAPASGLLPHRPSAKSSGCFENGPPWGQSPQSDVQWDCPRPLSPTNPTNGRRPRLWVVVDTQHHVSLRGLT